MDNNGIFNMSNASKLEENLINSNKTVFWQIKIPEYEIFLSDSFNDIFGYDAGDSMMFEHFLDIIHPDDRQDLSDSIKEMISGEINVFQKKCQLKNIDNNYCFVRICGGITYRKDHVINIAGNLIDVTDAELPKQEFQLIAENTSDGFLIFEHSKIKYVSPSYFKILGYQDKEIDLSIEKLVSLMHPEDRERVRSEIDEAIEKKKENLVYQFRVKSKNGKYLWIEDNTHFIYDSNGELYKSYAIARDITKQKEADQAILERERRFRAIVKALPDIIFRVDSNNEFIDVHVNDPSLLYVQPDQFLGKKVHEVMPEYVAEKTNKLIKKALESGKLQVFQYELDFDGEIKYFESRISRSDENEILAVVRDITENVRKQRSIEKSDQIFKALFATMPDMVLRTDLEGNIKFINQKGLELGGYKEDDVVDENVISFVDPEDKERVRKNLTLRIKEDVGPREYKLEMKDGSKIPFEVNGDILHDENDNPYGFVLVCRDLRERKKANEELQKQKKLFEEVLNASSVGLAYAVERKIIWANPAMEELFGYSKEEYEDKDTSMLYPSKEEYDKVGKLTYEKIIEKKPIKFDLRFKRKDGSIFWGQYKINPLDKENPAKGVIVSIVDIDDRKTAEERLKESQEILSDIFHSVKEGIVHTDLKGKIITINRSLEEITNIKKEELVGKNSLKMARKFLNSKNVIRVIPKMLDVIKGGTIRDLEIEYEDKILLINTKFNEISRRITGTLRDVTQQKKYEKELIRAKERAEESDKLKTAFLQNLSHEVRTPLNGIVGFAKLISEEDVDKETILESTEMIVSSSDRLISLIENVILLSELETNQLKMNKERIFPKDIVNSIEQKYRPFAKSKGLRFINLIQDQQNLISLNADKIAVKKIISLLVENALIFTEEGSVEVGAFLHDIKGLCFFVRDTGIGIDVKDLERIFKKFEKLNIFDKWMTPGTGIGLTIAKSLSELLGGSIEVVSTPGKGSTFTVCIPMNNKK